MNSQHEFAPIIFQANRNSGRVRQSTIGPGCARMILAQCDSVMKSGNVAPWNHWKADRRAMTVRHERIWTRPAPGWGIKDILVSVFFKAQQHQAGVPYF